MPSTTFARAVVEDLATIRRRQDAINDRLTAVTRERPLSLSDMQKLEQAQARADEVCRQMSTSAPMPLKGEDALKYRLRVARELQHFSKDWRDADLHVLARCDGFDPVERAIYADATAMALRPDFAPRGQLRKREEIDENGVKTINWHGSPKTWMRQFMAAPQAVRGFFRQTRHGAAERLG
jgi:hypothetical protein